MKKIITMLLVIGCIFAFASCAVTEPKPDDLVVDPVVDNEGNEITLETIQECIDASAPKGAYTTVKFTSNLGELDGSYNVTYNADGSATVEYSYELFNTLDPANGVTEFKSTHTGSVVISANGQIIGDLNGVASVEAVSYDITLDVKNMSSCSIDAGILQAVIPAAKTQNVLGVAIAYDVTLNIITSNGKVTSMAMAYTTEKGAVEIITTYNY